MFHHPAWAVGSYSSGHQPGELPKSKSTQPSRRPPESPCKVFYSGTHSTQPLLCGSSRMVTKLIKYPYSKLTSHTVNPGPPCIRCPFPRPFVKSSYPIPCRSLDTAAEGKRRRRRRGGDVGDGALEASPASNLKGCRCVFAASSTYRMLCSNAI